MLYKVGKIVSVGKSYIILESSFEGDIVHVLDTKEYEPLINKICKVYLYRYENEYQNSLYGFRTFKERVLFDDLVKISGIGPKTALACLQMGIDFICNAIAEGRANDISKLQGVGYKIAQQIIIELQEKYHNFLASSSGVSSKSESQPSIKKYIPLDIKEPLKTLGFSAKQIDLAVKSVKPNISIETMVEQAIKIISNAKPAEAH